MFLMANTQDFENQCTSDQINNGARQSSEGMNLSNYGQDLLKAQSKNESVCNALDTQIGGIEMTSPWTPPPYLPEVTGTGGILKQGSGDANPDTRGTGSLPKEGGTEIGDPRGTAGWPKGDATAIGDTRGTAGWPQGDATAIGDTRGIGSWPKDQGAKIGQGRGIGSWPKDTSTGIGEAPRGGTASSGDDIRTGNGAASSEESIAERQRRGTLPPTDAREHTNPEYPTTTSGGSGNKFGHRSMSF
jgi:hypothetical protein